MREGDPEEDAKQPNLYVCLTWCSNQHCYFLVMQIVNEEGLTTVLMAINIYMS